MQIKEINIDMDGVIADFDSLADTLCKRYFNVPLQQATKRQMWSAIGMFQKKTNDGFWHKLPVMEGALEMVNFIRELKIDYSILSAVGNKGFNANPQKYRWIADHFPFMPTVKLVESSSDKAKFAGPGIVLIDDRKKSIDPWIEAGGIGILHTSPERTIEELKRIL